MKEQPIGWLDADGNFWCAEHATDAVRADPDGSTPVYDSDEWFDGETCTRCGELVTRAT